MIGKLRKLLSLFIRHPVQQFSATINDAVYATPRDYMKLVLNEHGIKGQVGMCFLNSQYLILLVRAPDHIPHETTVAIEEKMRNRIGNTGDCIAPKEVFWAFTPKQGQSTVFKA